MLKIYGRPKLSADSQLVPSLHARAPTLMPASPLNPPWPERTAASSSPPVGHAFDLKTGQTGHSRPGCRRYTFSRRNLSLRPSYFVFDADAAMTQCEIFSGNEVISCFPTADTVFAQHEYATFVWNSNNPDFLQTERVDIYLFHGDSLEQVLAIPDQVNPSEQAGFVRRQVDDTWWGTRGANWNGSNISYPFYWLIARHGESLDDGTLKPQTTFSAVQTTFADSVLATRSSSLSSAQTTLSAPTTSLSSGGTIFSTSTPTPTPAHGVQNTSTSTPFPHWAIIVIVLGIVAVVAICGLMLFAIFYLREREKHDRHPIRSASPESPEMVQADEAAPAVAAAGLARDTSATSHGHDAQRAVSPDSLHEPRPFSGSDAAIMAKAFRAELRQPPGRSLDEDTDADGEGGSDEMATRAQSPERPDAERERETLLRRELEGADIRSVDSVRGVRVESSSEGHDRTTSPGRLSV
ncbi:hypothetical protein MVEN_00434600 [Mycena venus]|uniref:Uncharacterized protein n=1 Tax=Mycena venus TaxID=2733690 RepID=A0A8H6YVJ8_9AGAR|nr:hypothetical protein MVEN_00434600 [Mycena venus]